MYVPCHRGPSHRPPRWLHVPAVRARPQSLDMSDAIFTENLRKVYAAPSMRRFRGLSSRGSGPPPIVPFAPVRTTDKGVVALDTLDLRVREGEFFGLLGPNGAGKTTTIGILTTRVTPTSGRAMAVR